MTLTSFIIILLVAAVSAFVHFVTGFGYNIIMVALLPLLMPLGDAILLTLITVAAIGVWLIWDFRREIRPRVIALPAAFVAAGTVGGLFLIGFVAPALYLRIIGVVLILLAIWFLCFSARISIRATPLNGAAVGVIGGVFGALFAVAGPPLVLYYNSALEDKRVYMGALQATLLIQGVITITGRLAMGFWTAEIGCYLIPCVIGTALGAVPGRFLFGRLDSVKLKKIIYIFMCLAGVYIAVSA